MMMMMMSFELLFFFQSINLESWCNTKLYVNDFQLRFCLFNCHINKMPNTLLWDDFVTNTLNLIVCISQSSLRLWIMSKFRHKHFHQSKWFCHTSKIYLAYFSEVVLTDVLFNLPPPFTNYFRFSKEYFIKSSWRVFKFCSFLMKKHFRFLWLVDFNGIPTRLGLFYSKWLADYIHCRCNIYIFLMFLKTFFFWHAVICHVVLSNTNNFRSFKVSSIPI